MLIKVDDIFSVDETMIQLAIVEINDTDGNMSEIQIQNPLKGPPSYPDSTGIVFQT